jgi:UDP-N-acetylmuramoyl-tripeptide--D-alanyl-D-alanine ligase
VGFIKSKLVGDYNADNILAAVCVGTYFHVPAGDMIRAIENYEPTNNRSEFRKIGDNYFILDAYNANPSSMTAAIQNFASVDAESKIVILGDMLELGDYATTEHEQILLLALSGNFEETIVIGPEFTKAAQGEGRIRSFMKSDEAAAYVKQKNFKGKSILLKGSRGMQLEKIAASVA